MAPYPVRLVKRIWRISKQMAPSVGCSAARLAASFSRAHFLHGADRNEFRALHMYEFSGLKLATMLTNGRQKKLKSRYLNTSATAEDMRLFNDKAVFLRTFQPFIRRDWLYLPDSTPEQARAFIDRHPVFISKGASGNCGATVSLCRREELDVDAFLAESREKGLLLEEYIRQHPAIGAVNPTSVNTIRIMTIRYKGAVMIAGAGLRCGGAGAFLDNLHRGGAAYPIDLDTGLVSGPGRDYSGDLRLRHPSTGLVMPGLQVPHWELLKKTVCDAALVPHGVGLVGWDVAVTPEGVDLVEGNIGPGTTTIQLDGQGVYDRVMAFIARQDGRA